MIDVTTNNLIEARDVYVPTSDLSEETVALVDTGVLSKILSNIVKISADVLFGALSIFFIGVNVAEFVKTKKDEFKKWIIGSKIFSSVMHLCQGLISLGKVIYKCIVTAQKYLASMVFLKVFSVVGSVFSGIGSIVDLLRVSAGLAKNKDRVDTALRIAKLQGNADVVRKISMYNIIKAFEVTSACTSIAIAVIFAIQMIGIVVFPPIAIISLTVGMFAVTISSMALSLIFKPKKILSSL